MIEPAIVVECTMQPAGDNAAEKAVQAARNNSTEYAMSLTHVSLTECSMQAAPKLGANQSTEDEPADDANVESHNESYTGVKSVTEARPVAGEMLHPTAQNAAEVNSHTVEARKMRAIVRFELARLLESNATRLDKLFRVLKEFILLSALPQSSRGTHDDSMLPSFDKMGYLKRLKFVSNPTREVAICVFMIGEIFKQSKQKKLAQAYFAKARALDLKMVTDSPTVDKSVISILLKWKTPSFLKLSRQLLKFVFASDQEKSVMELEINLCLGEIFTQTSREEYEDKEIEAGELMNLHEHLLEHLGCELSSSEEDSSDELLNNDPQRYILDAESVLEATNLGARHVSSGKLLNIKANIARKNRDYETAHELYQQSGNVFRDNHCKLKTAEITQKDADIYVQEKQREKANELYRECQDLLQDVRISSEYANLLRKRAKLKEESGDIDERKKLDKEAEGIEARINEDQQKIKECVEKLGTQGEYLSRYSNMHHIL